MLTLLVLAGLFWLVWQVWKDQQAGASTGLSAQADTSKLPGFGEDFQIWASPGAIWYEPWTWSR